MNNGSDSPATGMDEYSDIQAQMDDSRTGDWVNTQFEELTRMAEQEQNPAGAPAEVPDVKPRTEAAERPASETPVPPPPPVTPKPKQPQEQAQTTTAEANEPEQKPKAAEAQADEADGLTYGPRRPEPLQREDLDKIIKSLSTEEQRDNTVLYRLDGEDAFRDLGNRLEMCNGASQDKRRVLAALAVASRFYGGVVELTGSTEFKEQAMRLIIENDLDIRMKLPAQRAQLDALRQQMGANNDAITSHIPTPDLNRHTPSPDAVPPVSTPSAAPDVAAPTPPGAPAAPVASGPAPQVPPAIPAESAVSPAPSPLADSIRVPEMPVEPAPSALKTGQSITAVLKNFGEAMYENKEQQGQSFFIELQNRGGSHTYWGQDLRELIGNHKAGDVVTLTLNSRDTWQVAGEERSA